MERNIYISNTPYQDALNIFIQKLTDCGFFKINEEIVDTMDAFDRITSLPVTAQRSSPHYPASAMDGIAVNASFTKTAHENNPITLKKNIDYTIVDTGDYVPNNYNAVIMIEDVNFINEDAKIIKPAVPWQNIRSIGEDLTANEQILPNFYKIGAYEIASLLTAAVDKITVVKKPTIAIIPTGTELVEKGSEIMTPGKIVESNSKMLSFLSEEWAATALCHSIVPDNKELIKSAVLSVKNDADLIIICSGSSAGTEDYTSSIVKELGEIIIHGLALKPGKPAILGIIDNKPVIGVPGYPISANLIFNLFAKPLIFKKQGLQEPKDPILECKVSKKIASSMGVDEFLNVNIAKINNSYICYPLERGAGITTNLVKADGILHIPRESEGLEAGTKIPIRLKRNKQIVDNTIINIGSHDMSIDFLSNIIHQNYGIRIISSNVGSMAGIMSLIKEEAHFAGIHLLDHDSGEYNVSYLEKYLANKNYVLINLVQREQGLIVKKGNPLNINSLADLQNSDVRYINRQRGSGTRILLDYLIEQNNINKTAINGYNREEFTHLSVAAAVKNDTCDTGMGIYASAKAFDLDFIPITVENYDLCFLTDSIEEKHLDIIINTINQNDFKKQVQLFGGYNLHLCGDIICRNMTGVGEK